MLLMTLLCLFVCCRPCQSDSMRALSELRDTDDASSMAALIENIVSLFSTRVDPTSYTHSAKFAREIVQLSRAVGECREVTSAC